MKVMVHHKPLSLLGFSLVELLVSVSVLTLLAVIVAGMVNATVSLSVTGRRHLDADSEARQVFDSLAQDFGNMVGRSDVDCVFAKQSGNDAFFFFSEAPAFYSGTTAPSAKNTVALVGYRINPDDSSPVLDRLGKSLTWDGKAVDQNTPGGVPFLSGTAPDFDTTSTITGIWGATIGTPATRFNGSDENFHVIADQVLRFEVCFYVKDLTSPTGSKAIYSNYPVAYFGASASNHTSLASTAPQSAQAGDRWYDPTNQRAYLCTGTRSDGPAWAPNGVNDVLGVVVTIAILDTNSRKLVPSRAYSALIGALADPQETDLQTTPPHFVATTWNDFAKSTGQVAQTAGIPRTAASQIRIYQRYFSLK
ncbi:MAG: type II secretion system protein J [Chthoniobacteraceae bacterium]